MTQERKGIPRRWLVAAMGTAPLFSCSSWSSRRSDPGNGTSTQSNAGMRTGSNPQSSADTEESASAASSVEASSSRDSGSREASTKSDSDPEQIDAVVVGAGLSGLVAARRLKRQGLRVRVLEAADRLGGRVLDHRIRGGVVAEGGAQWVSPSQTAILELAKELGVSTFDANVPGKTRYRLEGLVFDDAEQEDSPETRKLKRELDDLASKVQVEAPWLAPDAKRLDSVSVAQWLSRKGASTESVQAMAMLVAMILGDIERVSLLYFLFYITSAGGISKLETDAQSLRLEGGPEQLASKMAQELAGELRLNSPVMSVEQTKDLVTVSTNSASIKARRVILAINPVQARAIRFDPPMSFQRERLESLWEMNPGAKFHVVYKKPFWRSLGLSGTLVTDLPGTAFTVDASPPDASLGILALFPNEDLLPKSTAERKKSVLAELEAIFGPDAPRPIEYIETRWEEQKWVAGCTSVLGPSVLTQVGAALRESVGRIHWAGTESSAIWCGYMDGAVRAGIRAADELSNALSS